MKWFLLVVMTAGTCWGQIRGGGAFDASGRRLTRREVVLADIADADRSAPPLLPSTQPAATRPAEIVKLKMGEAEAAESRLAKVSIEAGRTIELDVKYGELKASRDLAESALAEARKSGSPQSRLDASGRYVAAKAKFETFVTESLSKNSDIATARDARDKAVRSHQQAKDAVAAATIHRENLLDTYVEEARLGATGRMPGAFIVIEILSPSEMVVRHETSRNWMNVILRGWDTRQAADGMKFRIGRPVIVVESKKVVGEEILFVIEPIEMP